jgi:D-3-phosphoglycerate dehydrogenase
MGQPYTILVTSDRYELSLEQGLLAGYPELTVDLRGAACDTEDELIAAAEGADALITSSREAVTRRVFEHLPRLKVMSRHGVGLDNVDLEAATEHGVVVTHFPMYCTDEVADHTMALILALQRRIVELDRDLRQGAWLEHGHHLDRILHGPLPALRELTLGLVGFGRIGRAVARRSSGYDLTIIAADPYVEDSAIIALGVTPVTLDELLGTANIVSLHCPLTPETAGLIGERELTMMKPHSLLVNTARGPVVDLGALIPVLRSGRLSAALDVVDPEPLPADSPLYTLPNVVLTPHAAYYSERSVDVLRTETFADTLAVLRGVQPRVVANPAVLSRLTLDPAPPRD